MEVCGTSLFLNPITHCWESESEGNTTLVPLSLLYSFHAIPAFFLLILAERVLSVSQIGRLAVQINRCGVRRHAVKRTVQLHCCNSCSSVFLFRPTPFHIFQQYCPFRTTPSTATYLRLILNLSQKQFRPHCESKQFRPPCKLFRQML